METAKVLIAAMRPGTFGKLHSQKKATGTRIRMMATCTLCDMANLSLRAQKSSIPRLSFRQSLTWTAPINVVFHQRVDGCRQEHPNDEACDLHQESVPVDLQDTHFVSLL